MDIFAGKVKLGNKRCNFTISIGSSAPILFLWWPTEHIQYSQQQHTCALNHYWSSLKKSSIGLWSCSSIYLHRLCSKRDSVARVDAMSKVQIDLLNSTEISTIRSLSSSWCFGLLSYLGHYYLNGGILREAFGAKLCLWLGYLEGGCTTSLGMPLSIGCVRSYRSREGCATSDRKEAEERLL